MTDEWRLESSRTLVYFSPSISRTHHTKTSIIFKLLSDSKSHQSSLCKKIFGWSLLGWMFCPVGQSVKEEVTWKLGVRATQERRRNRRQTRSPYRDISYAAQVLGKLRPKLTMHGTLHTVPSIYQPLTFQKRNLSHWAFSRPALYSNYLIKSSAHVCKMLTENQRKIRFKPLRNISISNFVFSLAPIVIFFPVEQAN